MSNLVERRFPDDFTPDLQKAVTKFMEDGMPGLSHYVSDQKKVAKLVSLYLQGHSVEEIAMNFGWPNEIVGFLVYKHNLYDLKQKTIEQLSKTVADKIQILKLKHINFLVNTADNIMNYYTQKMEEMENKSIPNRIKSFDELDSEWLKIYFKIVENLMSMMSGKEDAKTVPLPQINLQLPENSKIKKELDGSVSIISEKSEDVKKAVMDIMAYMAELKRQNSKPPNT